MKILNFRSLNLDNVYQVPHFLQAGETMAALSEAVHPVGKGLNQSLALARAGAPSVSRAPRASRPVHNSPKCRTPPRELRPGGGAARVRGRPSRWSGAVGPERRRAPPAVTTNPGYPLPRDALSEEGREHAKRKAQADVEHRLARGATGRQLVALEREGREGREPAADAHLEEELPSRAHHPTGRKGDDDADRERTDDVDCEGLVRKAPLRSDRDQPHEVAHHGAEEAAQTDDQALYHFYHLYPQAPEHAGACRGRNRQAPDILALHPTDSPQGFAWASKTTG